MASAVIGALRIILGADSAALDKTLKDAKGSVDDFSSQISKIGLAVGAAFTALYGTVSIAIANTIETMDQLGKQSQKIGIPVEQLSALRLAAQLSDVSMEQLGTGIGKLSKNMAEALGKPTSDAANAFRGLGISVKDSTGALKPTNELLLEIAEKFAGAKDGAAKTAYAIALFGKAGAELIPFLNQGRQGLVDITKEAAKFGIVIDTDTAKKAENFRDTLTRLSAAKEGLIIKLTAHLLPALQQLASRFLDNASNADKNRERLAFLTTAFDGLARGLLFVVDNFKALMGVMAGFVAFRLVTIVIELSVAFVQLARAIGLVGIAMVLLQALTKLGPQIVAGITVIGGTILLMSEDARKALGSIGNQILDTLGGAAVAALDKLGFSTKSLTDKMSNLQIGVQMLKDAYAKKAQAQEELNAKYLAGKTALDKYEESVNKHIAMQRASAIAAGQSYGELEKLKVIEEARAEAIKANLPWDAEQQARWERVGEAARMAASETKAYQIILDNRSPFEKYREELRLSEEAIIKLGASSEQVADNQQKVAEKFGMAWQNIATEVGNAIGSLGQIAGQFAKQNKTLGLASKAFGISQVIINTAVAVSKALAMEGPLGWAQAAAAVASGAAGIARISMQEFATGGALKVPGMGGGDRFFAPMMLSPGEQVDVWRPDQGGSDPRRGAEGPAREVTIRADGAWRPFVEALIPQINTAIRDGYELKLAPV